MKTIVSFNNVTKKYNNKTALNNISLKIKEGNIYGLIGENGAGKSTILKLIVNLVKATSGRIEVFGKEVTRDSFKYLKNIGVFIDEPKFYKKLTLKENFSIHCEYLGFYDEDMMMKTLNKVGLGEKGKSKINELSLGEKQRLAIAYALITKPELLILDEPTNGLDPLGIIQLRETLLKLNKEFNTTIIISSNNLRELEHLISGVAFIKDGEIIEEDTLDRIREKCSKFIEVEVVEPSRALTVLENNLGIRNLKLVNSSTIRIYEELNNRTIILDELVKSGIGILSFNMIQMSLEEYFIDKIRGNS